MLTVYGMSRHAPNLSLTDKAGNPFLGTGPVLQHRSEKLEEVIDTEMQEIIQTGYEEAKALISEKRDKLEALAKTLLKREKIDEKDILAILGPRPARKPKDAASLAA
jgi:cell division protease FtsH